MIIVIVIMSIYAIRHLSFTMNRTLGEQRIYYQDILDSDLPFVSIMIPMHNEELVATQVLDALLRCDYPRNRMEIIAINDHSTDKTAEILERYRQEHPIIVILSRLGDEPRGKPSALNDALDIAKGEIIVVFDADYIPSKGAIRDLAICFKDPEVGAVMGRVVPINTKSNLLTRLIDLERSGGYQVDQQARHNLRLMPQYGGTVGGFRKKVVIDLGKFDEFILAEDTDLTFDLFIKGWKVVYANRVECYEEVPENWQVRSRQIKRWARGHCQSMYKHFFPLLRSPYLNFKEKFDGFLLLCIYLIPFILLTGIVDSFILFFLGEMQIIYSIFVFLFVAGYNTFGNFAPFYEIGTAALLDGTTYRIRILPLFIFYFFLNIWNINVGLFDATLDRVRRRRAGWQKTARFRRNAET